MATLTKIASLGAGNTRAGARSLTSRRELHRNTRVGAYAPLVSLVPSRKGNVRL